MLTRTLLLSAAAGLALTATGAAAQEQMYHKGDFTLGLGVANVDPKDDNGTLSAGKLTLGDDTQFTLTAEYFLSDNIGLELLAATPFDHDIKLNGAKVGSVKELPPTISVNYHFNNKTKLTPFLGAGINYTYAVDVDSPLGALKLDHSWGGAVHAGFDYAVSPRGALRADVRWMDIDMKTKLDGATLGTAHVDPVVLGVSYIIKF